jgi:hypothetical protein
MPRPPAEREVGMVADIDLGQGLEEAWARIVTFVPKFVGFLLILVIGYFIAKFIAKLLDKVLDRVGFNGWVERGGVKAALDRTQYDAADVLSRIVFWTLMLFVLQLAFGVFGPNPISNLIHAIIAYLPKVSIAIVILVIASAVAAGVREIVRASLGGLAYGDALASVAFVAILSLGVFAALNQLEIAPEIVNGLFYALLAIVAGSAIIAIGGGGIQPMRRKWEESLARYDQEKPRLRQQMSGAGDRIARRKEELRAQLEGEAAVARQGPQPPGATTG